MRTYGSVLILLLTLCSALPAGAEDVILGRVLSLDEEGQTFTLEVLRGLAETGDAHVPATVTVPLPPEDNAMEKIVPGSMVRVWGGLSGRPSVFSATHVMTLAPRGDPRRDPTGVRHRLGRGRMFRGGPGRGGH